MSEHLMNDSSRAMVIEAVIEGLHRLILRNAAMLLSDLGLENNHELR